MSFLTKLFKRPEPEINWRLINIQLNSIETLFHMHMYVNESADHLGKMRNILNRVQSTIYYQKIQRKY